MATSVYEELVDHRHYKYRGCAPDPDDPSRAAGDVSLPVGAWSPPDLDGPEDQRARRDRERRALAVCGACPVLAQCRAVATATVLDGDRVRLAEPEGIMGGLLALERHRALIAVRMASRPAEPVPAPDHKLRTAQKLAVLRALVAHSDPVEVAAAAGLDVRTANWQTRRIATMLGLKGRPSRGEILAAAQARGLLDAARRAAEPSRAGRRSGGGPQGGRGHGQPCDSPDDRDGEHADGHPDGEDAPPRHVRLRAPDRRRFTHIPGQLALPTRPNLALVPADHTTRPDAVLEHAA